MTMPTFYDISVASYVQGLGGLSNSLKKGLDFCVDNQIEPEVLLETRLYPNMKPFRFQILQACHHTIGTLEGLESGSFSPNFGPVLDYAGLQALVDETILKLRSLKPEDVNSLETKRVNFVLGDLKLPFTATNFVLSFSLPNFYFHTTTAHDILRSIGVHVGKKHYMGRLRFETQA